MANHGNENHVEEISSTENTNATETKAPQKKQEQLVQKKVDKNLDFKTQQTNENYFFIFNIPDYEKEGVKVAILDNEVMFEYCPV